MNILRKVTWVGLACLTTALPLPVLGAQWSINSSISPEVEYTDNVCLSDNNKRSQAIALVSSNLRIAAKGRRASFDVGGSVQVSNLSDSKLDDLGCSSTGTGNRQQALPRLNAKANTELLENWLYIDMSANVDQNQVDPFRSGGGDSLNRTGNTNTFTRLSVSPYVSHRFEDFATLNFRYTKDDETNSEETAVADSAKESAVFSINSNEGAAALSWGLQADYSEVEYEETDALAAQSNELSSAQINLGYQFNRYWQINGFYGEEDNDFVSLSDENDGEFWDVGFRWTPNSRTTIDLGSGERFFGTTPRAAISHSYRRSTFTADYSRGVVNDRDIRSFGGVRSQAGDPLRPLDPVTGLPLDVGGNQASLTTSPIIDERFSLGYTYQFRRARLSLNASHSEQTRTEDEVEQTFQRYSISVSRNLSRVLSLNGALRYSKNEGSSGESSFGSGDNETLSANLGVTKPINTNMDLSFNYRYTSRQADTSFNEYDENSVTLTLQIRL